MRESSLLQTYRAHEWELLRFLTGRLGSASLAADIAHDLFLKLCGARDHPGIRDRKSYVFGMAANLATDHLRTERRRDEIRAEAERLVWRQADELTPERHVLARAELDHLEAAIADLPERCRRVFYLSRYEGKSQVEIADALGLGLTTVYKDLKLVMDRLVAARRGFDGNRHEKS